MRINAQLIDAVTEEVLSLLEGIRFENGYGIAAEVGTVLSVVPLFQRSADSVGVDDSN